MKWHLYLFPLLLASNNYLCADIHGTQLAGVTLICGGIYHLTKERPKKEEQTWRDSFLVSIGLIGCGTVLATNSSGAVNNFLRQFLSKRKTKTV